MSTNPHSKNFFNSIGDADDVAGNGTEIITIGIDHKFLRYFIRSGESSAIVFYGDYTLHSVMTPEELADQVSNILSKDTFLSKSYAAVKVCWHTDFEIIPTVFFDKEELGNETAVNEILNGEAQFIFELPASVNTVLENKFGVIEQYHSGAAMIEQLRKEEMAKPDCYFINVHAENMEVVYFDAAGSLKIYNRYEYKAYQDFIYFALLVADELKLDRHEVKAVLMGEINQDSQLYEITKRYFARLEFINPDGRNFSRSFEDYPKHFNYPLYNL